MKLIIVDKTLANRQYNLSNSRKVYTRWMFDMNTLASDIFLGCEYVASMPPAISLMSITNFNHPPPEGWITSFLPG